MESRISCVRGKLGQRAQAALSLLRPPFPGPTCPVSETRTKDAGKYPEIFPVWALLVGGLLCL